MNNYEKLLYKSNRQKHQLKILQDKCRKYNFTINNLQSKIDKAIEYLTSYDAISTIQGLDDIKKNKELDENTMNIMTNRYLKVHHNLLDILKEDK